MIDIIRTGEARKGPDYFQILEQKGFKFISKGEQWPSTSVNFEGFDFKTNQEACRQLVSGVAGACREYLSMWIAEDTFGSDHAARRTWRHEMDVEHGESFGLFYNGNKLRLGTFGTLQGYFEGLVSLLDRDNIHTPQAERVRELASSFPQISTEKEYGSMGQMERESLALELAKDPNVLVQRTYNNMSDTERIALSQRVDTVARAFLEMVSA